MKQIALSKLEPFSEKSFALAVHIAKALLLVLLLFNLCGCVWWQEESSEASEASEAEVVILTERQKEILAEGDLPTDYESLSYMQKKAILAIEEGLVYLEGKYGIAFSYSGYVAQQTLEDEHLYAYPTQGIKSYDGCTVWFDRSGDTTVYEDDFLQVALRDSFNAYIFQQAQAIFGAANVEIYTTLYSTSLSVEQVMTGELDASDYNGNVLSRNMIYVDANRVSAEEFTEYCDTFVAWLQSENLYSNNQFMYVQLENFEYLSAFNYTNYLGEEYCAKRMQITVETDGTISTMIIT